MKPILQHLYIGLLEGGHHNIWLFTNIKQTLCQAQICALFLYEHCGIFLLIQIHIFYPAKSCHQSDPHFLSLKVALFTHWAHKGGKFYTPGRNETDKGLRI